MNLQCASDCPELYSAEGEAVSAEIRNLLTLAGQHRTPLPPPEKLAKWDGKDCGHAGLITLYDLVAFCGLRPFHQILEPGCGTGRNARVIAPLLDPLVGQYMGFDVSEPHITWYQEYISSLYRNTRFDYADIQNSSNPAETVDPSEYRFPYRDSVFDIVFLTSVFSRMTRDGLEHYLAEIHRVAKPRSRPASCRKYPPIHAFTARNTVLPDRSSV